MTTATIKVYGIRATADGSGNVIATVEALVAGVPLPGRNADVQMSAAQFTAIWSQVGNPAKIAKFLETIALLDDRFGAASITAFLAANAASTAAVAGATSLTFPLSLSLTV
jgi:hypothetical protein